ncbi:MAG TPA: type IX secretion system plug protein domain-containing protein, partial [Chitinophagaceae bacterium]|nr:type IX secretion system plug protein domain-containing protein [Chitinophagaceae bacterium]
MKIPGILKTLLTLCIFFPFLESRAQLADHVYRPNIKAVKLFKAGDIYSYPIMTLNSGEQFELHFDDHDADVKNYYYSYQLCNADWTPSNLFTFDYIKGFQSNRITTYRHSSIAFTRYTHYQAYLPDRNCVPTRSGNYLLKVFINDDTSKLLFTKRFLVVDNKLSVAAQLSQPFGGQYFRTHQRVQVGVNTATARLNTFSPQDMKIVVLQNYVWPTAIFLDRPTIYRGNYYEYSGDELSFPAGKEWRWINLSSVRLMSDRMKDIGKGDTRTDVWVKPDG